ncbi:hypothetical protein GLAREA_07567 [Glarea lozoyensis ATCC 20868]|nr:uncharacterized protein GLAREA_07567 [Glarea lozoyensis ATCC 20868]EPE32434.1 hypothetical protein GLAREA_07567 [Glarea lozoyensis ATCC 20868]
MSGPDPTETNVPTSRPFTKAEHIKRLNDIDNSIAQLLESAGLALQTLSSSQASLPIPERKAAFETSSTTYIKTLQDIHVGLTRSIYGLEEAGIIPAEKAKAKAVPPKNFGDKQGVPEGKNFKTATEAQHIEGGMGKLDIGWLNSRSGRVDRDMEAELWEKARHFLQETQSGTSNGVDDDKGDEDVAMGD